MGRQQANPWTTGRDAEGHPAFARVTRSTQRRGKPTRPAPAPEAVDTSRLRAQPHVETNGTEWVESPLRRPGGI